MNYNDLKTAIRAVVFQNDDNLITGEALQGALLSMINSLGAGYQFIDTATPSTNPGTPDYNVFYIASTAGTYTNFNNTVLADGEVAILAYNGSWVKKSTNIATVTKLAEFSGGLGLVPLSQGSNGNPGSTTSVHTPVVPTKGAKYAAIVVSRPNASNCFYTYGYAITSSKDDIGITKAYSQWAGGVIKVDESSALRHSIIDLSAYPTAVGISFTIGERNSSATIQTRSAADYEGWAVRILCDNSVEQLIEQLILYNGIKERDELYNVSAAANVPYEIGYVSVSGGYFNYSDNNNFVRTKKGYSIHLFPGDIIGLSNYTDAYVNYYVKWMDGTYHAIGGQSSDFIVKVEGDYVFSIRNSTQRVQLNADDLGARIRVIRTHSIKQMIFSLRKGNGDAFMWNGSNGNPGNASFVHTEVLQTNGAKYAIIKTTRPNAAGCHYGYGYALTSNLADIGQIEAFAQWAGGIIKQDANANSTSYIIDISSYPTAVGISFTIGEYNANNVQQVLRLGDFTDYSVNIICDKALESFIDAMIAGYDSTGNRVLKRNKEREIALEAMCRYRRVSSPIKDIQLCICADSHADTIAVDNAVLATNGFGTIDALVHAGDICAGYYDTAQITAFQNSLANLTKPAYIVVGNHDVGNAYYVGYCCNHEQAYAAYIKPMVDAGWLISGEYQANKPYWYHDNATYKVRIIGLYEYDDNLDLNETYWRAITYNSALSNIALNTAYALGAQVNVPGYTAYSFEAVQAVTTPSSYYTTPEKFPSYKVRRGERVIRQTQAQWFLDTLLATPANYGVVVVLHNPFADDAVASLEAKFNQLSGSTATGASYSQNDMATDLIGGALAAFVAGSNYSENVAMKGNAAYLNTAGGGTYAYSVSKNFAGKNTGVKVYGLIGGHSHRDIIWKKGDLIQVTPLCATTDISNATSSDIRRENSDGLTKDSLTVISFASGRIGLVKIGVNVTENGTPRDYELIPTA